MKNFMQMLRPFDFVLVIASIALSFSPAAILNMTQDHAEGNDIYAVISIDGEEVDRFLLSGNEEHQLITYHPAPNQYNIVEIDGERIRNKEDNSPRQISVQMGWIQHPGETSLNIPHRFLIEIISEEPVETEIDIIA